VDIAVFFCEKLKQIE